MIELFKVPDKQNDHKRYTIYAMTLIWSLVVATIVSCGFSFFPHLWKRWLLFLLASFFIAVFTLLVNRTGYTRLASWSLIVMVWLLITIPCYSAGGISAPGIMMQVPVILTAGFLLGWRAGVIIGFCTIGVDFYFAYLQYNGQLPAPVVVHTPISRWVSAMIPFGTILFLQYYATDYLRSSLLVMQHEIEKREEAEKIKDQTLYNLGERIKELKTLYTVSQILQNEDSPYPELLGKITDALPAGWQFPSITAARIRVAENEYRTPHYSPGFSNQIAERKTASGTNIQLEIVYLQPKPTAYEGPFLKEERNLLNMLAEIIKTDLERRERKAELKDYQYALDISSIVSIANGEGDFLFVNENFCKISKYRAEELVGKDHRILWSGFHTPAYFEDMKNTLLKGKTFRGEFCNKAKDGSLYWVDSFIIPFVDENGRTYQYLSINNDITHRVNEAKRMNEAILNAQEKERLQIGMELHDNVKQILAGSGMYLEMAQKKIEEKETVRKILADLRQYNTEAINELRRLSHQLAPLVEEDTTLAEKIEWLIGSLSLQERLSISVHIDDFPVPLSNDIQLNFYRILQEQLSNILKYAHASDVLIKISSIQDIIQLEVADNGVGFDVKARKQGIGLENIRRRVQMFDGKFELVSFPGEGCRLSIQVPLTANTLSV